MTYFSNAFDIARRSWHFKIDFDKDENVSCWLVERGMPVRESKADQNNLAPNFSSVFMDLEVKCKSLGKRNMHMFYSFAHNSNQVIGISNVINVSQLLNGEEIEFKVHVSEYSLHSAVMHYLADNFSKLYKRDFHKLGDQNTRSIFSVPFCTVY
jgi:hypothetical protein